MRNNDPTSIDQVLDPVGKTGWPQEKGRDGERTPMQWNAGPNAGFSTAAKTWLPVGPEADTRNVATEAQDPASLLNYYKSLIHLRKTNAALNHGTLTLIGENDPDVLMFLRQDGSTRVLVALNFTPESQTLNLQLPSLTTLLASFASAGSMDPTLLTLPPFGAYIGMVGNNTGSPF